MTADEDSEFRTIPRGYWPLCLLLAALFLGGMHFLDRNTDPALGDRVTTVRWIISDDLTPPQQDAGWTPWGPPKWFTTHPNRASVWYELDLTGLGVATARNPAEPWVLYVPNPLGNITAFVDDILIGSGGSRVPPVAHHTAPLRFTIPTTSISQFADGSLGDNAPRLYVHRTHMDGGAALPVTYIGPASHFLDDHTHLMLLRLWIPLGILISTLVLNLIMVVLFLLRRQETIYGWYALLMFFWAIYQAWNLIHAPLLESAFLWRAISYVSLGLFVICSVFFVHRFLNRRPIVFERSLKIWSLTGTSLLFGFAAYPSLLYVKFGLFIWIPVALGLGLYMVFRLGVDTLNAPSRERLYLLAVASIVTVAGLRDFVWDLQVGLPGTTYYVGYTAGLVLLVFSVILMMRFIRALNDADQMRRHLSDLVTEKTQQLESNYQRLREVENQQAVSEERKRIMRDMHDGLGGQLVHALALSEQGADKDLQNSLRHALDDLRMVVDSLAPDYDGMAELLAAFRHRVSKSLDRAGVNVIWDIDDVTGDLGLDPKEALTVLRILQEAVTNAIRHSSCDTIRVSLSEDSSGIELRVSDDGNGIHETSPGRGLQNMRVRAREIGADLSIDSSSAGTTVSCRLAPASS